MSPSPVVREVAAPRRGAIAATAGQTQSETRSSMGPVGQVKSTHAQTDRQTEKQTDRERDRQKDGDVERQTAYRICLYYIELAIGIVVSVVDLVLL